MVKRFIHRDAGASGSGGETPETQLLEKVKGTVKVELEKRGFQGKSDVENLINSKLEGLDMDALRSYDAAKVTATLNSVAAEIEKVKNIRMGSDLDAHRNVLKDSVERLLFPAEGVSPVEMMMRSKGNGGTKEIVLNIRAAANMTTDNTINENSYPAEMIESVSLIDGVVKKRRGEQYIFDIADRRVVAELEQYTSWLEEGTEEGAFAIVAEGAVKPLVSTALVRNFAEAKKIAGKTVITEEFAKWRPKAWQAIQDLLRDKLQRDYAALLTTDLNAQAASYVGTTLDDTIVTPTDFDAIGAVAAQIETLNFFPDVLILHPQDKWRLVLQKDAENRYYMLVPFVDADGVVRMMGFRVVTSTYQTPGTFTLGESGLFKIEEETITIRLGYGIDVTVATIGTSGAQGVTAVSSDFDNNRMRMIIETYFKDWIATNHIGSFVRATFAAVKAALLKP